MEHSDSVSCLEPNFVMKVSADGAGIDFRYGGLQGYRLHLDR